MRRIAVSMRPADSLAGNPAPSRVPGWLVDRFNEAGGFARR